MMGYDLVLQLMYSTPENRKDIALRLADSGTDESVSELVRMAEARRRLNLMWYNLTDQMIGVEALGATRSRRALDYLLRAYETRDEKVIERQLVMPEGKDHPDMWAENILYTYPRVRRKLSELLRYTFLRYDHLGPEFDSALRMESNISMNEEAHQLFKSAIERLKMELT